jgi:adhesin/invasin
MIAAALAGGWVPRGDAADTVYTYNFNSLNGSNGYTVDLAGQDNWRLKTGTAAFKVITNGMDGTVEAAALNSAAYGEVYRTNNVNWGFMVGAGGKFTLQWKGRTESSRANEVGFATTNGTPIFKVGNDGSKWKFTPGTGSATTSAIGPTIAFWSATNTFVLTVDTAANSGSGSASFSVKVNNGTLTPIADMQNMNMNLVAAGRTPADMASLYLRGKDQARFDNIIITVTPAPPTMSISDGNAQSATAGTALANPLKVLVKDAGNNPVLGVAVTFAVATGGGSFASVDAVTSDVNGIATSTAWTLGTTAGTNTATATSAGLTGSPLTFTATGTAGAATKISISSGNGQSAATGTATVNPLKALVQDVNNNPVAGVSVTFAVATGGGSFASADPVLSGADGIATAPAWTLGTTAGENTATATSGSLTGSPLIFTATGTATPTKISISDGNGQSATAGTALANPLKVLVQDASDNPVAGVSVTFAVATGGGSFASAVPVISGADGVATAPAWTLGTAAGANSATATSGSLTGSPLTFTATGTAGAAAKISISAGSGQSAVAGTALANSLKALVQDSHNNPVAGVSVTFAVTTGGGSFASADPAVSGADGIATSTAWTLGTVAGANTATATSGTLSGSPLTFTATGTAGAAVKISISAGNGQTAWVSTVLANPLKALVQDSNDNPVAGVSVTFAVDAGGGSFASADAVLSGANGIATSTAWTLGAVAGANTATATSGSLTGSPLTFTATGTPQPTQISVYSGDNQTAEAGTAVTNLLQALVRDADGNPVAGVAVTFAVATGGGAFVNASPVLSDAGGIATAPAWTLGEVAGVQTATATSGTLTGSPLTFTATATVPPVFTYNFNKLIGGDAALGGQDGWVDAPTTNMKARGTTGTNVYAGTLGSGTGSGTATAYRNCSGAAAWPFVNSVKAFTVEWYSVAGLTTLGRISQLGLANAGGVPFFVIGGNRASWRFSSAVTNDTTGGVIGDGYQHFDCRLRVDLTAGTASFSMAPHLSGTWSEVTGMQNMALELPAGFVPSDMKSIFLRSYDQGSIDDIVITNIPTVPKGTLILIL